MAEVLEMPVAEPPIDTEPEGIPPMVVRLHPVITLSDDQLLQFCSLNSELRIERNANGDLIMMMPEGIPAGPIHMRLARRFDEWAEKDGTGVLYGSSTGFTLPNKAMRSPDVSWVSKKRLAALPRKKRRGFAPICPDFVLELRSESDSLTVLQAKMEEYLENGARLGWLLDPFRKRVYIYRPDRDVEELHDPETLSGENVLKGFKLDVRPIWQLLNEL